MSTNASYLMLNCLVPSCQNCDLDIVGWKKLRQTDSFTQCPRHKTGLCACTEPYKMIPFPANRQNSLKRLWIDLIQRPKDFEIKPWHGICSVHFVDEEPTDDIPFPVLEMGLQKWQIVQTLKAYYKSNDMINFEKILNEYLGSKKSDVVSKSVTIDLIQARNLLKKNLSKGSAHPATSIIPLNSSVESTLLNIPKLIEPVHITVGALSDGKKDTFFAISNNKPATNGNSLQTDKAFNSIIPGIRIFNSGAKSAPKTVAESAAPVQIVEQEVVVDETGIGFNTCTSGPNPKLRKRRLGPGRPPLDPNADDMDDFLYHPDITSKRFHRRKDAVICSFSKECVENYELCQMLIENLKQMTKNINDLNVRKQQLTSKQNCDRLTSKSTTVKKIDDCNQCSLLLKAYRNSIHQGRLLESQVSTAQLIQNGLLRKMSNQCDRLSVVNIKKRLEIKRNQINNAKFKCISKVDG